MTRFEQEINGCLGEFWINHAMKEIQEYQADADAGNILVDENGAAYWKRSGNYLPSDCVERLSYTTFAFNVDATNAAREKQQYETIKAYKEQMKNHEYSNEELYEMRAAFGVGTKIVDAITGKVVTL